ncbi:EscU/YscU/HrcU family type III secretion system export apparatus switch protein [Brucella anthropi]|uniref:EscU/YscU/HrcU family type III secretion system export apparatus switch protein n=1 Tax=Brucella anthropi TaxID=529 RepID=UPI00385041D4
MSGEKTEEPTNKKLEDQYKEGVVPQRKNVVEAIQVNLGVILIATMIQDLNVLLDAMRYTINAVSWDFNSALRQVVNAFRGVMIITFLFCVALSLSTLMACVMINKFNVTIRSLSPKIQKMNPISTIKSVMSRSTLYNMFRLLVYFFVLSACWYSIVLWFFPSVLYASKCGHECLLPIFGRIMYFIAIINVLLAVVFSLVDYRVQNKIFRRQNRMSKEDVRRESRNTEGSPEIKSMRRSLALTDHFAPSIGDVTHVVYGSGVLVAIMYNSDQLRPYLVLKSCGHNLPTIIEKFRRLDIRLVHLPNVAREFYSMTASGNFLPASSARGMNSVLRSITTVDDEWCIG